MNGSVLHPFPFRNVQYWELACLQNPKIKPEKLKSESPKSGNPSTAIEPSVSDLVVLQRFRAAEFVYRVFQAGCITLEVLPLSTFTRATSQRFLIPDSMFIKHETEVGETPVDRCQVPSCSNLPPFKKLDYIHKMDLSHTTLSSTAINTLVQLYVQNSLHLSLITRLLYKLCPSFPPLPSPSCVSVPPQLKHLVSAP